MALLVEPSQVGRREDLADMIAVVDAKSYPFVSMIKKGKDLGNMLHSWQMDAYEAPKGATGWPDGKDLGTSDHENPAAKRQRAYNYAQVFQRAYSIGFIANSISNVAGVSSEKARARAKALVHVKRDIEVAISSFDQDSRADTGDQTTGYLTKALGPWLDGTTSGTAQTATPSGFLTPSGSRNTTATASLVDADLAGVLASIYTERGENRDFDCICGTTFKRAVTALTAPATVTVQSTSTGVAATRVQTFNRELTSNELGARIDIYVGDFGRIMFHPTTFIGTTVASSSVYTSQPYRAYVVAMDELELRYGQLPEFQQLPDAGGGPKELVRMIASLVMNNPKGHGRYAPTA